MVSNGRLEMTLIWVSRKFAQPNLALNVSFSPGLNL